MTKKKYLIALLSLISTQPLFAQLNIGSNTAGETAATKSAILQVSPDLTSTTTTRRGFLLPSMTTTQRDETAFAASTVPGLVIYNSTTRQMETNVSATAGSPTWYIPPATSIYNADGTLAGNRTVNMGGYNLAFSGVGGFTLNSGNLKIGSVSTLTNVASSSKLLFDATYNSTTYTNPKLTLLNSGTLIIGLTSFNSILSGIVPRASSTECFLWMSGSTTTMALENNGNLYVQNVVAPSDFRIKRNIKTIPYGLNAINKLSPKRYDKLLAINELKNGKVVNQDKQTKVNTIGFIAQEVYEVIPQAAIKPKDENKEIWAVDYALFIPVLVKSIQEQQVQLDESKTNGSKLKTAVNQKAAALNELEQSIAMAELKITSIK